ADGSRRDRFLLNEIEDLARRFAKLFHKRLLDVREGDRSNAVQQIEKRIAVLHWEYVRLKRQHLPKLNECATHIFDHYAQTLWSRKISDVERPPKTGPSPGGQRQCVSENMSHDHLDEMRHSPNTGTEEHQLASCSKTDPKKIDLRRL